MAPNISCIARNNTFPEQYLRTTGYPNMSDWIMLILIGIFIIIINLVIVVAYVKNSTLSRKPANTLLCSQACCDLLLGTVYLPSRIVTEYGTSPDFKEFISCYTLFLSLLSLIALATDRYLVILKPFLHQYYVSKSLTRKVVLLTWVMPLPVTLLPLSWWFSKDKMTFQLPFLYVLYPLIFFSELAMVCVYVMIFKFVSNYIKNKTRKISQQDACMNSNMAQRLQIANMKREMKIATLFLSLLSFFIMAYTPILYVNLVYLIKRADLAPTWVMTLGLYLFALNSAANPVLTIFLKIDYQIAIKNILRNTNQIHQAQ